MPLESNKANAQAFYDLMFNQCRPREAIERYGIEPGSLIVHIPRSFGFVPYEPDR